MPEGDSVYRQAAMLHSALAGHQVLSSDFRVPAFATVDLVGAPVDRVLARGKHLLLYAAGLTVQSHLKMEGVWHVYPHSENGERPQWKRPGHTARCVLSTASHQAVGFALGELHVMKQGEEEPYLSHLGPDLLGLDWDPEEAERRLRLRPERSIGVALLDQTNLAGIGNVYRSEICFLARLHPQLPVAEVADMTAVIDISHKLLQVNKLRIRRCTTGSPTSALQYWVYGRARKACMRCGTTIQKSELGEERPRRAGMQDRVIYFCPACQPAA